MAGAFTLSGDVILRDQFTGTLEKLDAESKAAQQGLAGLGGALDSLGTAPGVEALREQIVRVRGELGTTAKGLAALGNAVNTETAQQRIHSLEASIAHLQAKAKSGVPLTIGEVEDFQRLNSELTHLQTGLAGVQGKAAGVKGAFSGIGSMLAGLGIAFGAQQLIGGTVAMVKMGASAAELRDSFEALTEASNINGDAMLASIQKASFGTISNVDAMLIANRALLSEQGKMLSSMPQIVTYAASVADALGKSTLEVTQAIVDSLATGQLRGLKEYGIVISQTDALAAAEALGQETDAMKRQEIVATLTTLALAEMAKKQALLGDNSASTMDQIDSLSVSWRNLKTAIGEAIIAGGGADVIGDVAFALSPTSRAAITETYDSIEKYADMLNKMGMAKEAAAALDQRTAIRNDPTTNINEQFAAYEKLRGELEKIIGPLGQFASSASDTGMVLMAQSVETIGAAFRAADPEAWSDKILRSGVAASTSASYYHTLAQAMRQVVDVSNAYAGTDFKTTLAKSSISSMENRLLGLVGIVSPDRINKLRSDYIAGEEKFMNSLAATDEWGVRSQQAIRDKGLNDNIAATEAAHRKIEKGAVEHQKRMFDSASSVSSAIEAALSGSMDVTSLDIQLSKEGKYKNKVNEAARQLAAIAQRGFSELKIHPDWAASLKIPPEILAGSSAQLKDWAGQTEADVNANLRPDLINWPAFVENFKKGMKDSITKGMTIDYALEQLKLAGIDTTNIDDEALKKQIAEQLGLAPPSISLDTLFKADEGAGADLIGQITGPDGFVEVPVKPILAVDTAGGKLAAEIAGAGSSPIVPTTIAPVVTGADTVGQDAANLLVTGFSLAISAADVGTLTLTAWSASFVAQADGFTAIGTNLGYIIAAAYRTAVFDNVEGFADDLADVLAPKVERAMKKQKGGKGVIE